MTVSSIFSSSKYVVCMRLSHLTCYAIIHVAICDAISGIITHSWIPKSEKEEDSDNSDDGD